jgi:hypothetical protein
MPHNSLTLLSREDLDRWHMRQELERARSAFWANPSPDNKARYLQACRAVLTCVITESEIQKPEELIDGAVAAIDAGLKSKN